MKRTSASAFRSRHAPPRRAHLTLVAADEFPRIGERRTRGVPRRVLRRVQQGAGGLPAAQGGETPALPPTPTSA